MSSLQQREIRKRKKQQSSGRIHSYDFFQGVLVTGLIFLMSFIHFSLNSFEIEVFYRWASLGFLFFSGVIVGEILSKKKNYSPYSGMRRGVQIFALFIGVNFFLFFSPHSFDQWEVLSVQIIKGDFSLSGLLLLPLSAFFFLTPLLKIIPSFLGAIWAFLVFLLLDIFSQEKGMLFINVLFLLIGILGFYVGNLFSLDYLRVFMYQKVKILPFLFLYIALAILVWGGSFETSFLFSQFWTFHLLLFLLFYFSLPSLLFSGVRNKSSLRIFFETIGVESLFVYVFISALIQGLLFLFPTIGQDSVFSPALLAFHFTILSFGVVSLLKKYLVRLPRIKKIFRFIF